jgi:broad specificity phosphatase PhoE
VGLELVYETHSLSTDNEAGIATGWLPGTLSERGRAFAEELGRRRRRDRIAAVHVSDLARAVETAQIAFAGAELPIHHDARLRECNYGDLNGMLGARLGAERVLHVDERWPNGESYRDVVDRMRHLLDDLVAVASDGSRLLLIGHSANKWALDHLILGRPLEELVAEGLAWKEGWEYAIDRGGRPS